MSLGIYRRLTLCGMIFLLIGCTDSDNPPTVEVSGQVTFDGEAPPAGGTLFFRPVAVKEGLPRQPGSGQFDEEGNYQVTSYEEYDGLVPGTYTVKVECWKESSGYMSEAQESYVPRGFEAPQLVVSADQEKVEYDLDVK